MGDRTYGTMQVLACPPEHVDGVLGVINDYGLRAFGREFAFGYTADELVLGETYTADEVSCAWTHEANPVLDALEGVAYRITEDPKYDWLGDVFYKLPDGTRHWGMTDAEENIVLTAATYESICKDAAGPVEILRRIHQHFDPDVVKRWDALATAVEALPVEKRTLVPADEDDE